jgi:hypothetical protein
MPARGDIKRMDNQRSRKSRDILTTGVRNIWHGSLICKRNAKSNQNAKNKNVRRKTTRRRT